jgi:hypothetical protein
MKIIFPTDEHCPYQDDAARSVALKICEEYKPDVRVALSDGLDFYAVSKFDKDPGAIKNGGLQNEIDVWKRCQREWLDASPGARVVSIEGNHENRLERYLWRHPELYGLDALKIENLLDFQKLSIEDVQNEVIFPGLRISHGKYVRRHSAMSAKAELEADYHTSTNLSGHTHRGGSHYATTRNGVVSAHECFCLCGLNPPYDPSPNWQQGITLATIYENTPSIEQIPFTRKNGKVVAYWRGKKYSE